MAESVPIWATGSHGEYRWLTTDKHDLDTLLRVCPQAVLGKRIAVTSLDSGPLRLNADEVSAGWLTRNDVAYSPRIESSRHWHTANVEALTNGTFSRMQLILGKWCGGIVSHRT